MQQFPGTTGPCPEPEWPDPDRVWHLLFCCWACWTPILRCSALCWVREIFLSSYFLAYNLLYIYSISFFQASGMLPVFVFSIWDLGVQKCYKIEYVLHQHKSLEKIPLQQSQLNWFSHLRNRCLWEKSHTHLNKNYISFWSLIYFWQRFGLKWFYFLNSPWVKIIKNERRTGFISIWI